MLRILVLQLVMGLVMASGLAPAQAAPFTLDDNLEVFELKFSDITDHPGMLWAGANGTLGDTPQHVTINGMTLQRQESAILISVGDEPVTLDIVKETWNDVLKSCSAAANDSCNVDFRTFGDAGLRISGAPGGRYQLILLASAEHGIDETLKSPVYSVGKEEINSMKMQAGKAVSTGGSGDFGFQSIVIVLLIVLILIVLAGVILVVKKKSTLQSVILLAGVSGLLLMQTVPVRAAPSGADGHFSEMSLEEWEELAETVAKEQVDALDKMGELRDVWLGSCDQTGNPVGEPRIPSFCAGDEACDQCYSDARGNFNQARATLEKLRLIYTCSQKFSKAAIAFGDSSSGIHAVVGMAWRQQKAGIEESVKGLQAAYDAKYIQLIGSLQDSMNQMGTCEQKFGVEDWYDRFGYIYYEFMADKYKRAD